MKLNLATSLSPDETKRDRVLDGAMKVFLAYGYQRVTMDDIARAADMSRPALYLLFRNKADIYRGIAERIFEASARQLEHVLSQPGDFGARLFTAIDSVLISMMQQIHASPHGAELLDLKGSLAGECAEAWHAASVHQFRRSIEQEAHEAGIDLAARGLTAQVLAELLMDGLEGMKHRISDADAQRLALRQLIRVLELALKP